ncbi:MAG: serine/threonine protein kinase [Deltaproteobacteria bacterium]|nr:serine/threonine protein kinase [Deltaproteobacteria bacterium]
MSLPARLGNGRYAVRGILGEGAQGVTYDALDEQSGRAVAIKRFDVKGARTWKDVELAEREARVLATLDHPLVPRYVDQFAESGALYLVMDKVDGETLEQIRRARGPMPEDEVRRFLSCADRAMTYLHGRSSPVVHRDVKPRNVVRRADGSYVFVDFGAVSELVLRRSGSSTVVGTIGFMAPEQLQGRAVAATDVYAVGATALAALTGVEPDALPHKGLKVDVRAALGGRASEGMIRTLEQMLEPDPERRAQSVAAALEAGIGASSGPSASPTAPLVPPQPPPPRMPTAGEDAAVKSIRNLLWVLWGLAWIIVPLLLREVGGPRYIPLVMFGSLAALFVVTWHKGAVIRAALRAISREGSLTGVGRAQGASSAPEVPSKHAAMTAPSAPARQRVEVGDAERVRVHTMDLAPEDVVGNTDVDALESDGRRRARR